jgi:RNA polymerase sigma-70 factor (ECF subfamily)
LARIRQGDPQALDDWFRQNVDSVYAFVFYRVGNDPDLAADATQAAFAAALERLAEYDPERGDMVSWLRTLSRNIVRDTLRQHRRETQLALVWERIDETLKRVYERIDQDLLPDEAMERQETRELVGMTLASLPPQYRDVLQAKYVDGHPLEAIARMRETTLDSVKSMLRRARLAFKETFLTLAQTEIT